MKSVEERDDDVKTFIVRNRFESVLANYKDLVIYEDRRKELMDIVIGKYPGDEINIRTFFDHLQVVSFVDKVIIFAANTFNAIKEEFQNTSSNQNTLLFFT